MSPSLRFLVTGGDHMTLAQLALAALLGLTGLARTPYPLRAAIFLAFAVCAGLNVGTWVQRALQEVGYCAGSGWAWLPDLDFFSSRGSCSATNELAMTALAYTAGLYACFAGSALLSPRKHAWPAWTATALSCGLWIMFASHLLARLGLASAGVFDAVYVRGGMVLYALKTAYDTAVMVGEIEQGDDDVLGHALTQLLNFLHLFIRAITILADSRKKRNED